MEDNGGPAFPFGQMSEATGQPINGFYAPGMTLRDYFAAKAMQALALDHESAPDERDVTAHYLALRSYEIADAMLQERAK